MKRTTLIHMVSLLMAVLMCASPVSVMASSGIRESAGQETAGLGSADGSRQITLEGTFDYGSAEAVLELLNAQRAQQGEAALNASSSLTEAAMTRAAELSVCFSHTRPDGSGFYTACSDAWGENIAAGQTSARDVFGAWMKSVPHQENMLNAEWTAAGIGCFEHNGIRYWVQEFGYGGDGSLGSGSRQETVTIDVCADTAESWQGDKSLSAALSVAAGGSGSRRLKVANASSSASWLSFIPAASEVVWYSDNPEVLSVGTDGYYQGVSGGQTEMKAYLPSAGITFSFPVTVTGTLQLSDSEASSPTAAFVTRLYELVLNRKPDATGLQFWTRRLLNGRGTAADTAAGFVLSSEMQSRGLSDSDYVTVMYRTLLNREPDAGGLAGWVSCLTGGLSRKYIIQGFTASEEFTQLCAGYGVSRGSYASDDIRDAHQQAAAFAVRMYTKCLGRNFDEAGLVSWVTQLVAGTCSGSDITKGFFFSQEYSTAGHDGASFVRTAYRTILGREAEAAGLAHWTSALSAGSSQAEILDGFLQSAEFAELCGQYGINAF